MTGRLRQAIRHGLAGLLWPLAGLAALMVVLACVLVIPQVLVSWELGASVDTLTAADRAKAINDVRTTLLQGIGGAVILLGAYFTYRQLQTAREGQVTERFTRAIDQLGSPAVDVRIGGTYGLERIARDSVADRVAVIEVLAAFVRNHAPWPPKTAQEDPVSDLRRRMPDVQAAMTVLGRVDRTDLPDEFELQLGATDLRDAFLHQADLQRAYLRNVHFEKATLTNTALRGTYLHNAHLQAAYLLDADLQGAILRGADLQGADLRGADLRGADLQDANLRRAKADQTTNGRPGLTRRPSAWISNGLKVSSNLDPRSKPSREWSR